MLGAAWLLGEAFHRIGQPALVGQLLAGVVVGPSLLGLVQPTSALSTIESIALFFVMLMTGFAASPRKILAAGKRGLAVSTFAFLVPFLAGYEIAHLFGLPTVSALTVGLTISITAVPTNAVILMDLGLIDTALGSTVIAAGVVDDIISFAGLGLIEHGANGTITAGFEELWVIGARLAVFFAALLLTGYLIRSNTGKLREMIRRILETKSGSPGSGVMVVVIVGLIVSLFAEWAGLQLVIGAFFAGLLLSELLGERAVKATSDVMRPAAFGFFAPLAFAFIGTQLLISSVDASILLFVVILPTAIVTKLFGGYVGAAVARFSRIDSVTIGLLMNSRGFLELVIASTAFQVGLIDESVFSLVVAVGIITTIVSPVTARLASRRRRRDGEGTPDAGRERRRSETTIHSESTSAIRPEMSRLMSDD